MTFYTFSVLVNASNLDDFDGNPIVLDTSIVGLSPAGLDARLINLDEGVSKVEISITNPLKIKSYSVSPNGKVNNFGTPKIRINKNKLTLKVFEITMTNNGVQNPITKPYSLDLVIHVSNP